MSVSIRDLSFPIKNCKDSNIRNRAQLSTYLKSVKPEKPIRPKSSAIRINPGGLETFYIPKRNQTVPIIKDNTKILIDDKNTEFPSESVRAYRFHSAPEKRRARQQNNFDRDHDYVEDRNKVYNIGPGYVIYKNDSEFNIRIDSDEFFGPRKKDERTESSKTQFLSHKDAIICQLEEQIGNLTVYLEEAKINNNLSLIKYQKQLELTRSTLIENYTVEIENLKEEHSNLMTKTEVKHDKKLQNQKEELEEKFNIIQKELNTFKASFESYRQSLVKETDQKLENEKNQFLEKYELRLRETLEKQKNEMKFNLDIENNKIKQEHLSEIEHIKSTYKREIEMLNKRFAGTVAVEEKLSQTIQELEKKKRDYQKLQNDYDNLKQMYSKSEKKLTVSLNEIENLRGEIQEFSETFEQRVQNVDVKYKQKIDTLQTQIIEMRQAYIAKCEELVKEKNQSENQLQNRIKTAKDVMIKLIQTKHRSGISFISSDTNDNLEEPLSENLQSLNKEVEFKSNIACGTSCRILMRPVSGPSTNKDLRMVKHQSSMINKCLL